MSVKKCICDICGMEVSASNMSKHIRRHENHPETFKVSVYKLNHDGLACQFCNTIWKNRNSLCNHERQCKANPNAQLSYFNVYNNLPGHIAWNKGLTKETDERMARVSEAHLGTSKPMSEETKQKLSASITLAYAEGRLGTRLHRLKHDRNYYGTYKGFECDSSYELAFIVYCLDHDITVSRNNDYFMYTFDGIKHKYFPDFVVDDQYIEIKGRVQEQDKAKWQQFPKDKTLKIIAGNAIKKYIKYCKETYGSHFVELYDSDKPSWKDRLTK